MTSWSALAEEYADAITAAEQPIGDKTVKAYHDPQKAANNRPCILVDLPTADYTHVLSGDMQPDLTWRLIALASKDTGALSTFHETQSLVAAAAFVFNIDSARPATYLLGTARVPCYVISLTL